MVPVWSKLDHSELILLTREGYEWAYQLCGLRLSDRKLTFSYAIFCYFEHKCTFPKPEFPLSKCTEVLVYQPTNVTQRPTPGSIGHYRPNISFINVTRRGNKYSTFNGKGSRGPHKKTPTDIAKRKKMQNATKRKKETTYRKGNGATNNAIKRKPL